MQLKVPWCTGSLGSQSVFPCAGTLKAMPCSLMLLGDCIPDSGLVSSWSCRSREWILQFQDALADRVLRIFMLGSLPAGQEKGALCSLALGSQCWPTCWVFWGPATDQIHDGDLKNFICDTNNHASAAGSRIKFLRFYCINKLISARASSLTFLGVSRCNRNLIQQVRNLCGQLLTAFDI